MPQKIYPTDLRFAHDAFIDSDRFLRDSGERNVAVRFAAIVGSEFKTLWYSLIEFSGLSRACRRFSFSYV